MLDHLPLHCSWGAYKSRFRRGVDEALERAYAGEVAERTETIVEILQSGMDLTQGDGVWIADATIRVHVQAVFPHRRRTGVFWLVRRPSVECDAVIGTCIDGSDPDRQDHLLLRSDQLAHRSRALYLRCDDRKRARRFGVAPDALAARVAQMRFTCREASDERMLQEARAHELVNFAELARVLDWPYRIVRTKYWRLLGKGEWFPPLKRKAGRRIEIVCVRCGKSRLTEPARALKHGFGVCFACATRRPRRLVEIRCPSCGRLAERWPSAVKKLSSGAQSVCRKCRMRAGIKSALTPSAVSVIV
jgi:DNA-binding transcriptional regulator YdaS (Cro superfamily)